MKPGCYTAIVTPFLDGQVDYAGLEKLVDFQIANGVTGILAVGTTGESPSLAWDEHHRVTAHVVEKTQGKCLAIAGTGSNNTQEALAATRHAVETGADAVLLVDPYYNGPSSLEIRREYIGPIAAAFPGVDVIPYVIPGRTGAQLLPEDLGLLSQKFKNVRTVKEATGSLENMRRTRSVCGRDFTILSGDDALTYTVMTDPLILAAGVISVISNVAPAAVSEMVGLLLNGDKTQAEKRMRLLEPLFNLVTVKTTEKTPFGEVVCRARNPLALKTLMAVLGMPAGSCRQPLGKMTANGLETVLGAARKVFAADPRVFQPVADFFGVDVEARLNSLNFRMGLSYETY
ncbi:MAG: 4-hydroxy-tetrahydrodipicolinate synthase [Desulfobacteraceae bacterium]|nr:4-hydroxy-tetrahydrodipicolinate synthase [Desulfobacteraceae bacterium]